jgi:membrane-bound lytic murein transglycosylase B
MEAIRPSWALFRLRFRLSVSFFPVPSFPFLPLPFLSFRPALRLGVLVTVWAAIWGGGAVQAQGTAAGSKAQPVKVSSAAASSASKPRIAPTVPQRRLASWVDGSGPSYAKRADAMKLADEIADQQGLDRAWVRRQIARVRQVPQAMERVLPPAPGSRARDWQQYRGNYLQTQRIGAGVAFWRQHEALLERASAQYGVPPEIIVGILGVETYYGRNTGNFRVIEVLTTLSLDFPTAHPRAAARTAFFREELAAFLKKCHTAKLDPFQLRGSYAGAMGIPQFMPSNWARYGVDFDGDGAVDLSGSMADAIGSVANYFKSFNWKPGMPTHYAVSFDYTVLDLPVLLGPDIKPTFPVEQFTAMGVLLGHDARQHEGPLALVELQNGSYSPSYVAGTENFYAVTRYNWSSYYALAVIELGEAIGQAMAANRARSPEAAARVSPHRENAVSEVAAEEKSTRM